MIHKLSKIMAKRSFGSIPVWSQRYRWVSDFLTAHTDIETVTDIGSGNGRVSAWYKSVAQIGQVNFVEKDYEELTRPEPYNYYQPPTMEMILGRRDIDKPIYLNCFHGDAVIPDERLVADCIIMIEVIEHLVPKDVESITKVVFGFYQPKYVIVTTPNREFNPLFDDFDQTKFRHPDHKFEWDRGEFTNYCQQVCSAYPYQFVIDGVGEFEDSAPFGFGKSTQIVAFKRDIPDSQVVRNIHDWLPMDMLVDRMQIKDSPYDDNSLKSIKLLRTIRVPGDTREPELRVPCIVDSWT